MPLFAVTREFNQLTFLFGSKISTSAVRRLVMGSSAKAKRRRSCSTCTDSLNTSRKALNSSRNCAVSSSSRCDSSICRRNSSRCETLSTVERGRLDASRRGLALIQASISVFVGPPANAWGGVVRASAGKSMGSVIARPKSKAVDYGSGGGGRVHFAVCIYHPLTRLTLCLLALKLKEFSAYLLT